MARGSHAQRRLTASGGGPDLQVACVGAPDGFLDEFLPITTGIRLNRWF
jgi:hypothetical protein